MSSPLGAACIIRVLYNPRVLPSNSFEYPEGAYLPYLKHHDEFVIGLIGGSVFVMATFCDICSGCR